MNPSALKHLSYGKDVALITDARFSGVSTGACIGHVGPEALAGGPIGKLRTGDWIDIRLQLQTLNGTIHMVGDGAAPVTIDEGTAILAIEDHTLKGCSSFDLGQALDHPFIFI